MSPTSPGVRADAPAERPSDPRDGSAAPGGRISDREFGLLRDLIERESGIDLSDSKRALLVRRLQGRMRQLELPSHGDYFERVTQEASELELLLDCITTNETRFFRDKGQFETLASTLVPRWLKGAEQRRRPPRLRVWSAACSTGEEPYSVAMALRAALPSWWELEILATDLSHEVLGTARGAIYGADRIEEIPGGYSKRFLLRGVEAQRGRLRVAPEIRELVRFGHLNLVKDSFDSIGPVDLLLCRNVLMYFSQRTRRRVARRLLERLAPGGHVFVGHAESIHGVSSRLRVIGPSMYRLRARGHGTDGTLRR